VQAHLVEDLGEGYVPSPWFRFRTLADPRPRWCQPDGLHFDFERGRIVIVEVKLQHTIDAWWQLEHLYLPVVQFAFPVPEWELAVCEVTKWYDPATAFPVRPVLCRDILRAKREDFSVHIWRP